MEDRHPWDQEPAHKRFWHGIVDLSHRLFPERQIMVRTDGRMSYVKISRKLQMSTTFSLAIFGGWIAFSSFSYFIHQDVLAAKDRAVSNANIAYNGLLSEVGQYQKKFSTVTTELVQNHNLMLQLVEQNATLQQSLKSVASKLDNTEQDKLAVVATRERLRNELSSLDNRMQKLASKNFSLEKNLSSLESNLTKVAGERTSAIDEGKNLKDRVNELENVLADLQESEKSVMQRMTNHTGERIAAIENVLKRTGVKLEKILAANGIESGMGGPFIAANPQEGQSDDVLKTSLANLDGQIKRWAGLRSIMNSLPLFSPLDYYYITSSYGKRRDPKNRKLAHHYGLDMGSSYKAPVFTAAGGKVTYAGWKTKYGNFVEIDHGNGVKSRYGHMAKIFVKRGQKIEQRVKIGLVGNTGRSTGAHLHYEILVNGKTVDPIKFIKAGRYVFKG
ncbi:MAG: peptidoglycan DD-metalloendopeptidase family protein [Rhodospirillales bacterium]|nr:peptidoglycan DD-metalloendopeptidase family protein [Rhodospirillales bacterium]